MASVPLVAGASQALADNEIIEKMVADKRAAGWVEPEVTQRGYMDITIGDKPAGRLVIAVSAWARVRACGRASEVCRALVTLRYCFLCLRWGKMVFVDSVRRKKNVSAGRSKK